MNGWHEKLIFDWTIQGTNQHVCSKPANWILSGNISASLAKREVVNFSWYVFIIILFLDHIIKFVTLFKVLYCVHKDFFSLSRQVRNEEITINLWRPLLPWFCKLLCSIKQTKKNHESLLVSAWHTRFKLMPIVQHNQGSVLVCCVCYMMSPIVYLWYLHNVHMQFTDSLTKY